VWLQSCTLTTLTIQLTQAGAGIIDARYQDFFELVIKVDGCGVVPPVSATGANKTQHLLRKRVKSGTRLHSPV
jgi:hypothetical protein